MVSDIWYRTIQIVREEAHCHHMGYTFQLAARVLLYAPSHRQDNTHHSLPLLYQSWSTDWKEKQIDRSTRFDPMTHEWTLYHEATSCSCPLVETLNKTKQNFCSNIHPRLTIREVLHIASCQQVTTKLMPLHVYKT